MPKKRVSVQEQLDALVGRIKSMEEQCVLDRKFARGNAYAQMLNTFLNIVKFAQQQEPNQKKRRNSKQFQRMQSLPVMQTFLKVVFPDRVVSVDDAVRFCQKVDSLNDQRNRLMHPRDVVELQDDAHRFAAMLESHRNRGDALDYKESLFLDVFSKIDELCAYRIGNLVTRSLK
jgi:hypothetical protein